MSDWKYYNHALIPSCAPHEQPDVSQLKEEFKKNKKALFARWTTNWDCGYETEWWYVIKDEPFDIDKLKSKRRYEINRGRKNFKVKIIEPNKYIDELYNVQQKAWDSYPEKYRPTIDYIQFENEIINWRKQIVFGAFNNDNILCGYARLTENKNFVEFDQLKVVPEYEKMGINAAIIFEILIYYEEYLFNNFYIIDGSRPTFHQTAFQDYLEKYFDFRKVYCILHLKYKCIIGFIISILYPFRNFIKNVNNKILYKIYAILKMEEYSQKCKKIKQEISNG